ncbi:FKBP-type peptidyl-prolyl cis-trans isomerase [Coniochaeta ligniaria NRRL 30616]|uniref:peptidylprolyl isomerase n=1 Tax=Coniochaeta ligniaria NRRL 30616 TaxID=1408157 RepID=A0A1J7J134_9PEZI|nr:FKBP-type peptidyl-prolyl cis-trans isomerase [Coniochaeta ligniaria NRRL 30616]
MTVLGQDSDLIIEVTVSVVCDRKTHKNDTISVNYRGTFLNGTEFDSSAYSKLPRPFSFKLGAGDVIQGFDRGLLDMCIGEQRKLTIPPRPGYGNRTVGPIPANSTLVFYTELMGIEGVPKPDSITK